MNTQMIEAILTATRSPYPGTCWWNDSKINEIINDAVRQGFVNRHSVTQVEWTEKGIESYKKETEKETVTILPIANGKYTLETYMNTKGKPCLKFTTERGKVICNFYYNTEQERDAAAIKKGEYLERLENDKEDRRAGARGRKLESIKAVELGTIFYTSWGYDQTNVDFYQVVKISGMKIQVRRIYGETVETGFMSGNTTPVADDFRNDEVLTVGLTQCGGFRIEGHYANIHESGRAHSCSWYG